MKLLNLFLILIILYLCYKIFNNNEKFQDGNLEQLKTSWEAGAALRTIPTTSTIHRINLDNTEIINNKNIFINYSQDQLEELNKISELDLNKRNLIIDNSNADKEKVSISNNLCVGNFCINEDNLKTISGKIDGPQFYKTMEKTTGELYDKPIYYNNDCNLLSNTTPFNKCDISNVNDLPNKLCFNVEEEMPEVITTSVAGTTSVSGVPKSKRNSKVCIEAKDFDILNGKRGIKLKHLNSNKVDLTEYNKKLDYYIKKDKELEYHISDYYDPTNDPTITSKTSATGNQYKNREFCEILLPPTLNKDTNTIEQICCKATDIIDESEKTNDRIVIDNDPYQKIYSGCLKLDETKDNCASGKVDYDYQCSKQNRNTADTNLLGKGTNTQKKYRCEPTETPDQTDCKNNFKNSAQGKLYDYEWYRRNKRGSKYGENDKKECDKYNVSDNTRLPKLEGEDYGKCCNEIYPGKDCLINFLKEHKKDLLIEDILENISYLKKKKFIEEKSIMLSEVEKYKEYINVSLKKVLIDKINDNDNVNDIVMGLVGYLSNNEIKKYVNYDNDTLNGSISDKKFKLISSIINWKNDNAILYNLIDNLSDRKLKKYVKTIGDGVLYNDRSGCNKKNDNWKLPPSKTQDAKCCNEAYPGEGKKKCIDGFKKENPNYLDGIDKPDSKDTGTAGKYDAKCPLTSNLLDKWRLPDGYCCNDSDPNGRYHGIGPKAECVMHYFNKYYKIDNETKLINTKYDHDKYLMPYYLDFKQSGFNIEGTKDQLFFKNNDECTHNNSLYKLNPQFDPRKYPFYKSKLEELNCNIEEYECWEDCTSDQNSNGECNGKTVSKRARLCPHTCKKALEEEFFGVDSDKCNQILTGDTEEAAQPIIDTQKEKKAAAEPKWKQDLINATKKKQAKEAADRAAAAAAGGGEKDDYCAFGIYPDAQKVDYELQRRWHQNTDYDTQGIFIGYDGEGEDAAVKVKSNFTNTYEEDVPTNENMPPFIDFGYQKQHGVIENANKWGGLTRTHRDDKKKTEKNNWIRDCGSLNKGDIKVKDGQCIPRKLSLGTGYMADAPSSEYRFDKFCESGFAMFEPTCRDEHNNYEKYRCYNRYHIDLDEERNTPNLPNRYCLNYKSKEVNKQGEKEKIITKKDRGKTGKYKSYCPRLGKRGKPEILGTDRWGFDTVPDSADPFRILENGCCAGRGYYEVEGAPSIQKENIQTKEQCIKHYEAAVKKDETSVENNHGWYMLPDHKDIDPTYNGYYIDQNNNNTKYLMKDNAISKASKYLGIIDNHRSSDNGKCGYDIFNGAQAKYFCDGKNNNNSKYDNLCNPITFVEKQIQEQIGEDEDEGDDEIDEEIEPKIYHGNCLRNSPYEQKSDCASGKTRWTPTSCKKKRGERNYRCVPSVEPVTIPATTKPATTLQDKISIKRNLESETVSNPLTEYKSSDNRSDIEEVHYVLKPAKNTSGNIIKSNTYFHGHEHSH